MYVCMYYSTCQINEIEVTAKLNGGRGCRPKHARKMTHRSTVFGQDCIVSYYSDTAEYNEKYVVCRNPKMRVRILPETTNISLYSAGED